MKEIGSGTAYNTHNTTSLIRTLKHVSDILQTEEASTVKEYTHTHTHVGSKYLTDILEILQKEYETAINWFKTNNMIVNPDKFQSMIISSNKNLSKSVSNINGVELTMESSVKLLGIEIDNKLNFEKHISNICQKASNQLNAIFADCKHLWVIKKKKQ